jgi:hypothetical protein
MKRHSLREDTGEAYPREAEGFKKGKITNAGYLCFVRENDGSFPGYERFQAG